MNIIEYIEKEAWFSPFTQGVSSRMVVNIKISEEDRVIEDNIRNMCSEYFPNIFYEDLAVFCYPGYEQQLEELRDKISDICIVSPISMAPNAETEVGHPKTENDIRGMKAFMVALWEPINRSADEQLKIRLLDDIRSKDVVYAEKGELLEFMEAHKEATALGINCGHIISNIFECEDHTYYMNVNIKEKQPEFHGNPVVAAQKIADMFSLIHMPDKQMILLFDENFNIYMSKIPDSIIKAREMMCSVTNVTDVHYIEMDWFPGDYNYGFKGNHALMFYYGTKDYDLKYKNIEIFNLDLSRE